MLLIAVQVFLSYSSRNLTETPSSIFKSIAHDADLSWNGKMQHLQNYVVGRAKSAVEGYGYSGDDYHAALRELEA